MDLLFVGSSHGPEGAIAAEAGFEFRAIASSKLTKSVSLSNASALMKLAAGIPRARKILRDFGADVVLGTGGYTTAAVLVAARTLGRGVVIHEQNAVPGRTNMWLARIADKICVSVESSAAFFSAKKVELTGMPIRADFSALADKLAARRALGMNPEAFTLVVVGGSQGARRINELVVESLTWLWDDGIQVLHQAGERNVQDVSARYDMLYGDLGGQMPYYLKAYVDMPSAIAAADLIISRSGASTIAEITAAGLPSVLLPYPHAYANHQKRNAEYLVQHGAAVMVEDDSVTPRMLADIVVDLRRSPEKLQRMSAAAKSLGKPDAAQRVAEVVLSVAGR